MLCDELFHTLWMSLQTIRRLISLLSPGSDIWNTYVDCGDCGLQQLQLLSVLPGIHRQSQNVVVPAQSSENKIKLDVIVLIVQTLRMLLHEHQTGHQLGHQIPSLRRCDVQANSALMSLWEIKCTYTALLENWGGFLKQVFFDASTAILRSRTRGQKKKLHKGRYHYPYTVNKWKIS